MGTLFSMVERMSSRSGDFSVNVMAPSMMPSAWEMYLSISVLSNVFRVEMISSGFILSIY